MKFREAVARIDKSEPYEPNFEAFCKEMRYDQFPHWHVPTEVLSRFKSYYLLKWYCTDSYVGALLYFLDDVFVAFSFQRGRKCPVEIEFVSKDAAMSIINYFDDCVKSLPEEERNMPDFSIIDMDDDVGEIYRVEFVSQLLVESGLYDDKPVKILPPCQQSREITDRQVNVELDDGSIISIPIKELKIPLHVVPQSTTVK